MCIAAGCGNTFLDDVFGRVPGDEPKEFILCGWKRLWLIKKFKCLDKGFMAEKGLVWLDLTLSLVGV